MRIAPSTERVPAAVNRYLLPHERQVISVHRHPAALIGPSGLVVAGLVAALVMTGVSNLSGDAQLLIWLIWAILVLYLIGRVLGWAVAYYVVTSHRILFVKGFLGRDVAMVPLGQAVGMRLRRSSTGLLLGYGQLLMPTRGQDQALRVLNYVPYPEQIYLEVCGLIYREYTEE